MMQTILVLGAGKGIGKAVADLGHERGHKIIAVSRSYEDIKDRNYTSLIGDLTLPQSFSQLNPYASTIDSIINCTGTHPGFDHLKIDGEIINGINENLTPALNIYDKFLPIFQERGRGHFIHISSGALDFSEFSEAGYCASKAALEQLVLCIQNGDKEHKLLHHAVRVSLTNTPLARRVCPDIKDWSEFYTPEETSRYIIDIVEKPENYPFPIVKLPLKPIR